MRAMQTEQRFAVGFTPLPTAARVTQQRRAMRWRWVTTLISIAILAVLLIWFRPDWPLWVLVLFAAFWIASSVFWLIVSLVGLSRAKRDLARIQPGICFFIDPEGLSFLWPGEVRMRWGEIDEIKAIGSSGGAGPRLAVIVDGKPVVDVAFSVLDASPSVIDSMVRANSLGKHSLEAHKLETTV